MHFQMLPATRNSLVFLCTLFFYCLSIRMFSKRLNNSLRCSLFGVGVWDLSLFLSLKILECLFLSYWRESPVWWIVFIPVWCLPVFLKCLSVQNTLKSLGTILFSHFRIVFLKCVWISVHITRMLLASWQEGLVSVPEYLFSLE